MALLTPAQVAGIASGVHAMRLDGVEQALRLFGTLRGAAQRALPLRHR